MGVANAELPAAVLSIGHDADDLRTPSGELGMEGVDVVDIDVDVEHVWQDGSAVRRRADVGEAGEVHPHLPAVRIGVVTRILVEVGHLEAELVPAELPGDLHVFDKQDRRVCSDLRQNGQPRGSGCKRNT